MSETDKIKPNAEAADRLDGTVSFLRDDVITVAKAMTEDAVQREYQGDYGMHEYLYVCHHCHAESPVDGELKHEADCPVLIAQDLLTGS